jgi:hypothetical protein
MRILEGLDRDATDPVRDFEHVHGHLTELATGVGRLLRDEHGQPRTMSTEQRKDLLSLLERLRDDLLVHFADEEEALFPFVRQRVPSGSDTVDQLEAAHDAICGAVIRIAHLTRHRADWQLITLYEHFEEVYTRHARDEAALFEDLGRRLSGADRSELASLLHGLSHR